MQHRRLRTGCLLALVALGYPAAAGFAEPKGAASLSGLIDSTGLALPDARPDADQPWPRYRLAVRFSIDTARRRGSVEGLMAIQGWQRQAGGSRRCLYLPYNDSDYEFDPIRDFDLVPRKYAKVERHHGTMSVRVQTPGVDASFLSPHVLQLSGPIPANGLDLAFAATLPRWPDADTNEWLFSDFHPQPLVECPKNAADSRTFTFEPHADISAHVSYAGAWQVISPGIGVDSLTAGPAQLQQHGPQRLQLQARKLPIGFVRGFSQRIFQVEGTTVELTTRDPDTAKILPSLTTALQVANDMYGSLPFPHLVILETSDLEKSSLPGLVTVNHPRQVGAAALQSEFLNWTDWQITSFVAEQWFGASITVRNLDDLWLLRGLVDFTTLEALASVPQRFSLLRADATKPSSDQQTFNYRGAQDLLAAVLTYLHPYNALTGLNYVSLEPFAKQHSLSHIRHALALRQINWTIGRATMRKILRQLFTKFRGSHLTPRDFAEFYVRAVEAASTDQRSTNAATHLSQWWTTNEWPDFELIDVNDQPATNGHGHDINVTLIQHNGFSLPVTVTLIDDEGQTHTEAAKALDQTPGLWQASFHTTAASDHVEIDQSRQILDWDRFNNNDRWPQANFFPGPAKTFADDAYTVLWLPLATKLPGEPLTYQLVGQGFRYLHNSLTGMLTYATDQKKVGYSLYYLTDFPKLASYLVVDALQDKGLSFRNERVVEAGLYKTLGWLKDPYFEYGLRLRHREVMGNPKSRHQTIAFKSLVQPLNQYGACNYAGKLEYETTVHQIDPSYDYSRRFAEGDGSCKVGEYLELGARAFFGNLMQRGPDNGGNVRFDPQDVNEARLRFDDPRLGRTEQIWTVGADILVPAYLPIPDDLYLLKRQARYRLFYDFGASEGPHRMYKDAGVGLWLPIGIDLVGKGSVSPLNFSFLLVLYREAGDFRSRAPGVLFDFDFIGKI